MSGYLAGTSILRPVLHEIVNYGAMFEISAEQCEHFYWHYEAVDWTLPNGGLIRNWKAKLQQWKLQNRIYDKQAKERDEKAALAKRKEPEWHDYRWYQEQVLENPKKARGIVSEKVGGVVRFRWPEGVGNG